jgi:hypothetical protein
VSGGILLLRDANSARLAGREPEQTEMSTRNSDDWLAWENLHV